MTTQAGEVTGPESGPGNEGSSAGESNALGDASRKRDFRGSLTGPDNSGERSIRGHSASKRAKTSENGQQTFACPFFKKDVVRYHTCGERELKRIKDVKQHLERRHYIRYYCPRCWLKWNDHLRASSCELRLGRFEQQLRDSQVQALHRRADPKMPSEEQ